MRLKSKQTSQVVKKNLEKKRSCEKKVICYLFKIETSVHVLVEQKFTRTLAPFTVPKNSDEREKFQ